MSLSPRLYLAAGLLAVVAVAAGVSAYLVLSKPSYDSRTVMVATARTPDGKPPGADALDRARKVVGDRAGKAGMADPEVTVEGAALRVSVGGNQDLKAMRQLVAPAVLGFRKVLAAAPDPAGAPDPSAGAQNPSSSAADPSAGATPTPGGTAGKGVSRDAVIARLGPAYQIAESLTTPEQAATVTGQLAPFAALTPAEVAALPAKIQFVVPAIGCATLAARPAGTAADPAAPVAACDKGERLLLDVAKVTGPDLRDASAKAGENGTGWMVTVRFTSAGQARWKDLTTEAYGGGKADRVAIVLDDRVVTAPQIAGVIAGDAQITGTFTPIDAQVLAAQIGSGSLPLTFTITSIQNVPR